MADEKSSRLRQTCRKACQQTARRPSVAGFRRFSASPAFGLSVAAVLLICLLVLRGLERGEEGPEAGSAAAEATVPDPITRIVFVGEAPEFVSAVESSENFDPTTLVTASDLDSALFQPDPKVLIDFGAGTLSVYARGGEKALSEPLPEDPDDLAAAISVALGQP